MALVELGAPRPARMQALLLRCLEDSDVAMARCLLHIGAPLPPASTLAHLFDLRKPVFFEGSMRYAHLYLLVVHLLDTSGQRAEVIKLLLRQGVLPPNPKALAVQAIGHGHIGVLDALHDLHRLDLRMCWRVAVCFLSLPTQSPNEHSGARETIAWLRADEARERWGRDELLWTADQAVLVPVPARAIIDSAGLEMVQRETRQRLKIEKRQLAVTLRQQHHQVQRAQAHQLRQQCRRRQQLPARGQQHRHHRPPPQTAQQPRLPHRGPKQPRRQQRQQQKKQ